VNPVVAVIVGYYFGGEGLGLRTLLGTLLVLVSVVVITTTPRQSLTQPQIVKGGYAADQSVGD
jgi:drug/metabolite transporter (DMT)-like permease